MTARAATTEPAAKDAAAAPKDLSPLELDELHRVRAQDPTYEGLHPEPRFFLTDESEDELGGTHMVLNMGPQHPATHGTLRVLLQLEGERIASADTEIGYLHTGFEKLAEYMTYHQWVTVTDRMNYMSAINNNVGYALAVEDLLQIEVPRRAQVLRVILCEVSRIADHILCCGLQGMDMGAFSLMLWSFERREKIYDIIEAVTGARLTTSYTRIGGLFRDVPSDFRELMTTFLRDFPRFVDEFEKMAIDNRIFEDRLRGTGKISGPDAVAWGLTGPILRASGVPYDVRKTAPYSGYDRYDFSVPTQADGDSWARLMQRLAEIRQSLRIIAQALDDLPEGPIICESKKIALPEKVDVFDNIESLIHHFKLIMFGHGISPPRGAETYFATEAPNGELGYYIVADGDMIPYKIRVRPPSIYNYAIYTELIRGALVSDAVAVLSSLNVIAGELDR